MNFDIESFDDWEAHKKQDRKRNIIFWCFISIISIVFSVWFTWVQSNVKDKVCTDTQTVTEVQAIGHKQSTSYYVVGDRGGKGELYEIVKVGEEACFRWEFPHSDRKPIKQWVKEDLL